VKPETELTFLLGITEITDRDGINAIQEKIQARDIEQSRIKQQAQMGLDTVAIDAYLATNNIVAIKDKTGLRYVIKQQGKGESPTVASTLKINYRGVIMESGRVFDQTTTSPVEYPLSQLILGWQYGFPLLSRGSKATLYIPSSLGYGSNGYPPDIPGNANLIFDVELIDFK
jgi:FKBP-type peptidyl-prolyl cis-trans isomerase